MAPPVEGSAPPAHHGGFLQHFGLDVRVAALFLIIDNVVVASSFATLGIFYVAELVAGVVLGLITYKIQRHWYGDDHHSALIKALVVGLLTAIPVPVLPSLPVGTAGFLGLLNMLRPKRRVPSS
jgi:hypothetical protein